MRGRRCDGSISGASRFGRVGAALFLALILEGCLGREGPPQEIHPPVEEPAAPGAALPAAPPVSDELEAYVERLLRRVAAHAAVAGLELVIADTPVPNAFATPDGQIAVTRGLIALANSEDELTHVLGHEIAHVVGGHHLAPLPRPDSGGIVGTLLGMVFTNLAELAAYSRTQERYADDLGQRLATQAGADATAMASFFRSLHALDRAHHAASRERTFLETHPSHVGRATDAALRASTWSQAPEAGSEEAREAYLRRLDGLLLSQNPAHGVVRGRVFVQPLLGYSIAIPPGWRVLNPPEGLTLVSPRRDAAVIVQSARPGTDPEAVARVHLAHKGKEWSVHDARRTRVRGLAAFEVRAEELGDLPVTIHASWLAWRGTILRIESVIVHGNSFRNLDTVSRAERSFRPIHPSQSETDALRLRLVAAEEGEILAHLSARTENAWDVATTSAFNGLPIDALLPGGMLIKIARREAYLHPPGSESPVAGTKE